MAETRLWPDQLPELWDSAADAYDETANRIMPQFAEDALDAVSLQRGERLLDVATGTGVLALAAAKRGADVFAIDFAPAMVDQLRNRVQHEGMTGVQTEVMDGQNLDLHGASFDVAASQFGVNLFPDRAKGFREMYRVLKPGGRAVVVTWSAIHRVEPMFAFLEAMQQAETDSLPWEGLPPALSLQDPDDFAQELQDAGFTDIDVQRSAHQLTADSAAEFWNELKGFIPTITALVDALGDEKAEAIGNTYIQILRDRYGDGPLSLSCEGLIGVGVK